MIACASKSRLSNAAAPNAQCEGGGIGMIVMWRTTFLAPPPTRRHREYAVKQGLGFATVGVGVAF